MQVKIKTVWDFSNTSVVDYVVDGLKKISNPLKADIDITTGNIQAKFKGKDFESYSYLTPGFNDTIILDPKIHGQLSNYDFQYFGTFFRVYDIGSKMDKNVIYISIDGSANTPNYLTWIILGDKIEAEFLIDPRNIKNKLLYAGIRQNRVLKYLEADPDVQIIHNGIMDAADLVRDRTAIAAMNSPIPIKPNQFGRITIKLDVGFPDTVNDLINYVKQYKHELYRKVN